MALCMKCGSFVLRVPARRKGSGETYERVKETISWWGTRDLGIRADKAALTSAELVERGYTVCDGNIVATIKAVDEPDWGCTYAKLDVSYKCDACGQSFFPELAEDSEALSRFVTDAVAGMSERKAADMRAATLREHNERWKIPA